MNKVLLLPALALVASLTGPASADDAPAQREIAISPAELTTPAGAEAVHGRIHAAAQSACRAENRGGAASERSIRICTQDTVDRTVAALDAPLLTAHNSQEAVRIRLASLPR